MTERLVDGVQDAIAQPFLIARVTSSSMTYSPMGAMPEVAELQLRHYRAMSPAEKLARADALWDLAWDATRAGIRMRHPDYDESAVTSAARAIFRSAAD